MWDHAAVRSFQTKTAAKITNGVAKDAVRLAKVYAPKSRTPVYSNPRGWGGSGNLRRSIRGSKLRFKGPIAERTIIANTKYAAAVHDGAESHFIDGKNGGNLNFWWFKAQARVSTPRVFHPGVRRPNPFLDEAIRQAMALNGITVIE